MNDVEDEGRATKQTLFCTYHTRTINVPGEWEEFAWRATDILFFEPTFCSYVESCKIYVSWLSTK
jgi:hypothetical protein